MTPLLSLIIPVFYNSETLEELHRRILLAFENRLTPQELEIIFVDDGSEDASFQILRNLSRQDPHRVRVVRLSRNFGSHAAVLAGLTCCRGRYAAVLTADLQDPPEIVWEMLERARENQERVVLACRKERKENRAKVALANLYYWAMRRFTSAKFPSGGFDCFLIERKVVEALVHLNETNTSLTAQILWMGFHPSIIEYVKQTRLKGKSRWSTRKKLKLFMDSVISFSHTPIRLMEWTGILTTTFGFVYAGIVIVHRLKAGREVEGWASLMVVTLCFSGIILASLGVVGEYLWRILDAARKRPAFLISEKINFTHETRINHSHEKTQNDGASY